LPRLLRLLERERRAQRDPAGERGREYHADDQTPRRSERGVFDGLRESLVPGQHRVDQIVALHEQVEQDSGDVKGHEQQQDIEHDLVRFACRIARIVKTKWLSGPEATASLSCAIRPRPLAAPAGQDQHAPAAQRIVSDDGRRLAFARCPEIGETAPGPSRSCRSERSIRRGSPQHAEHHQPQHDEADGLVQIDLAVFTGPPERAEQRDDTPAGTGEPARPRAGPCPSVASRKLSWQPLHAAHRREGGTDAVKIAAGGRRPKIAGLRHEITRSALEIGRALPDGGERFGLRPIRAGAAREPVADVAGRLVQRLRAGADHARSGAGFFSSSPIAFIARPNC
jgi:hypothetical protein